MQSYSDNIPRDYVSVLLCTYSYSSCTFDSLSRGYAIIEYMKTVNTVLVTNYKEI